MSTILYVNYDLDTIQILKNAALVGFQEIEVIDLDTIDVSNLNRQFLFRSEHVGQPKAVIAAEAAKRFNNNITITAHYGNIKNTMFGVSYFKTFDIVLNALDNADARRHVNRLCLASDVPLIDSGTTGYLGQVTPIIKTVTTCYECYPKTTQKVYPICTIRSTPTQPVHCIVWAKECLKLIFGNTKESMLYEDTENTDESSTYMHLLQYNRSNSISMSSSISNSALDITNNDTTISIINYGKELLIALYHTEIIKRIDMDVYKTATTIPVPIATQIIEDAAQKTMNIILTKTKSPSQKSGWDNIIFTTEDNVIEFLLCIYEIFCKDTNNNLIGTLTFDKDDQWAMRFVTVASNLRSTVFSIKTLSFYDAKGIAGNIIPAIATTNAIVAGLQVLGAINLIINKTNPNKEEVPIKDLCPHTYVSREPNRKGNYLSPSTPDEPNPNCFVCGKTQIIVRIDVAKSTLGELISKVVKGRLSFNEPTIVLQSNILYEEGDDVDKEDYEDSLPMKLNSCPGGGIHDGCIISIQDFSQDLEVGIDILCVGITDNSYNQPCHRCYVYNCYVCVKMYRKSCSISICTITNKHFNCIHRRR